MELAASAVNLSGNYVQEETKGIRTDKSSGGFQTVLKTLSETGIESMDSIFQEAASIYGISEKLLKAVAKAESNFNPKAVSKAGAIGVMQLMPATAKALGVLDPYDARQNIMGGAKYLKENLERFGGNVNLALAAYNAGPNSVQKYGGIPPYKETQNYVKTINNYLNGGPISSGKTVAKTSGLSGSMGLGSYYGSSLSGLGSAYGLNAGSLTGSSSYGSGLSSLSGFYSTNALSMLLGTASVDEEGGTVSLDKDSFSSLVQILRLQMMMNASREIGSFSL